MSYIMTEVYRGTNPGYGAGPLVIATYGANDDRYAYGTEHEVYEAPESLGTGHRGFKAEVIASITRELADAENSEPCGIDFLDAMFAECDKKRIDALKRATFQTDTVQSPLAGCKKPNNGR